MKRIILSLLLLLPLLGLSQSVDGPLKTITASGTNTYTTLEPLPAVYTLNERFLVRFTNANTGASTLNRAGIGAIAIKKPGGIDVASGDIKAGEVKILSYNGTYYQLVGGGGSGGSGGYIISASPPSDISVNWIDVSSTTIPQAYPIKRYINGAWTTESLDCDWWDDAGKVISKGRPIVVVYSGQSNTAATYYYPDAGTYGASYTGDVAYDPYVIVFNTTSSQFKVYDFADQAGSTGSGEGGWTLNVGANNLQVMGKTLAKETGRSVRFVGARRGGTPLAAWESGRAMWTELVAYINQSNIKYADAFVWIQGEGGLTDINYPTSNFATYRQSFYDMINRLKLNAWSNGATIFNQYTKILSPSHGLGHQLTMLSFGDADNAEGTIRSLDATDQSYYGWVQTPWRKTIQDIPGGKSTSSTSVNLSTVTNGFSITIGTGLAVYYPVNINNPVAIVSRANRKNNLFGTISAYNNSTGLLTFNQIEYINGTATASDWDVMPQDRYHWSVPDHETIGASMAKRFMSLPSTKKKENSFVTYQQSQDGVIKSSYESHYPVDDTQIIWNSRSNNSGKLDLSFATTSATPTTTLRFIANGQLSKTDFVIIQSGTELSRWNGNGILQSAPIYWKNINNSNQDTRIEMLADGFFGLKYVAGSTGNLNSNHNFFLGLNNAFQISENTGNGYRYNMGGSLGGAIYLTNTTNKLSRVIESRGALAGSLSAGGTQTSTIFVNTPITDIPPFSIIDVELIITGCTSTVSSSFVISKKGQFTVANYGTVTFVSDGPVSIIETNPNIISSITLSVVSGQISATLNRGSFVGTFNFSSITTATIKTF